ncbi:hypothetical protein [Taibaiella helva]|uniref:hypothetical protein n=1 Tax=Taibaiella helva TaxID=2301235 RepID=UPI001300794D|nr:hypothetical protein [Taibaiella helva]
MNRTSLLVLCCLLGILLVSSCKKDYTCTCTVERTKYIYEYPNQMKSEAKESCDQQDAAARMTDPNGNCTLAKD